MRTIKLVQIGLVTVLALGGATVQYSRTPSTGPTSPFDLQAASPDTLYNYVQATCGACHNNDTFTQAGDFRLNNGANARAGGIVAQTRGILATDMTGADPLTALIVQKPLEGSITPHGGIKLAESHPVMQALIAWVNNGAPANDMNPPAAVAPAYRVGVPAGQHEVLYVRRTNNLGGFRSLTSATAGGRLHLLRVDDAGAVISDVDLTAAAGIGVGDDVQNPAVSLDGTKVAFSRKQPGQRWKIWEMNIDGTGLRQITTGSSGDDVQPWYLPYNPLYANDPQAADPARAGEGGIGFISNRAGFRDEYEATLSMNPYVCDANGGNVRQIDFNPSHSVHPMLHTSGVTLFTRWEHNEHQGHNFMPLFAIAASDWRIGGTNLFAAFGEHGTGPGNSLHDPIEDFTYQANTPNGDLNATGWVIARGSSRDGRGGSIVGPFFPRIETPHAAVNILARGDDDEMRGSMEMETNLTSTTYRSPASLLSNDRYLVCTATLTGVVSEFNEFNGATTTTRVYGKFKVQMFTRLADEATNFVDVLDFDPVFNFDEPTPVVVLQTPKRVGKPIDLTKNTGLFTSGKINSRQNDGQPSNFPVSRISKVRFIRALQFSQGTVDTGRDTDEGIATQILGDVTPEPDGSFAVNVPAKVPIQFQLIDTEGRVHVSHKPWVQVAPGETMRCVGCHSNHSAPAEVQTLEARQKDPVTLSAGGVVQFNFADHIQPILIKCVACHDYALKAGAAANLSLVGREVPGGETESYQELIGKGMVRTQRPKSSPLIWRLTGLRLDQDPPPAYPPTGEVVPHTEILTAAELTKLQDWISAGINFRVVDDGTVSTLNALDPNVFANQVWPILENSCLACHSTGNQGGLAMNLDGNPEDAESEGEVMENRLEEVSSRVNYMVPQASHILRKPLGEPLGGLSHVGGQIFTGFDDAQYRTIYAWIAAANPALAPGVPATDIATVQNHPNPFRDSTIFVYQLTGSAAANVTLRIYSQGGKMIRELAGPGEVGGTTMGWNRVEWDGKDKNGKTVGNDVYFYLVEAKFNDGVKKTIRGKCVKLK